MIFANSILKVFNLFRSLLSGEGVEKVPILEGNVQMQGGYECGEKVISVLHTPDGNAVGKWNLFNGFSLFKMKFDKFLLIKMKLFFFTSWRIDEWLH